MLRRFAETGPPRQRFDFRRRHQRPEITAMLCQQLAETAIFPGSHPVPDRVAG